MIPIRDVVPTRTRPAATRALAATMAAALAWPAVRRGWLPWCATVLACWIFGRTVEDRLGHGRFALLVAAGAAAALAAAWRLGEAPAPGLAAAGAAAGVMAAYFLLFPRSKILTLVPVLVGVELVDVPAWVIAGLWALIHAADLWARAAFAGRPQAAALAGAIAAGAAAGVIGWLLLRRPERLSVEWWDTPSKRP
ncbi:MAG TPA: rhomboid family intramembrane serine protease [Vicinamibacterales bacterium]|nr:rhomboid family intramembrane serine protease [Vicinamibacterales bacterium]